MEIYLVALEWLSFSIAALTTWCYGNSLKWGASFGILTSLLFIIWGISSELYGAGTINVGFLVLHSRNLRKAIK